ncbi:MAG: hypothetical protein JWR09_2635 [Mucilaginibacter sp.]|nr:hypothetical protein [Mucilaginibacter sp.]
MKTFLLFFVLLTGNRPPIKTVVYLCDSTNPKKYHLKNDCRGLSRCTHHIIEITLEVAKKRKLELCKLEQ